MIAHSAPVALCSRPRVVVHPLARMVIANRETLLGSLVSMVEWPVLVPAGTNHNIINTGQVPLKLYTLVAPPNHRDGVAHHARDEAEADTEHFDGKTTEWGAARSFPEPRHSRRSGIR